LCLKAEKQKNEAIVNKRPKSAPIFKAEKYTHLLIGKVKDTQIMFSYIIEASVVEQSGPVNGMS
jgi:hypothetical protein